MNLKKMLLVSYAILGVQAASFAQDNFAYEISGQFPGADKIYLSGDMFGALRLDSAVNTAGKFLFKGKAKKISLGAIEVKTKVKLFPQYFSVFIEPGNTKVKLYEGGCQIEARGTKNNDIMSTVESENKDFWRDLDPIYHKINFASMTLSDLRKADVVNKDSISYYEKLSEEMEKQAAPYIARRNEKLKASFIKYPNTFYTAYYAMNTDLPDETLKKMYTTFDAKIKNSDIGKQWVERVIQPEETIIGTVAPNFTAPDVTGKQISLADLKGKYVLLDFWATWCSPCRAGNPHLIELYKKYKEKGIEFVGVADDDANVAGWKKAILNDGIGLWPQVLRNRGKLNANGDNSDISKLFKVTGYPTMVLIDKEGKIVHIFGGDKEELGQQLEELLKS
jgi:thiol-disulfide isomerase/thioredoxin